MRPFLLFRVAMAVAAYLVALIVVPTFDTAHDYASRPVLFVCAAVWFWAVFGVLAFVKDVLGRWQEEPEEAVQADALELEEWPEVAVAA